MNRFRIICACLFSFAYQTLAVGGVIENRVPLGLPPLPAPVTADVRIIALGKQIFFDRSLSADGKINCASCHDPARAFSGPTALPIGAFGAVGTRRAPTLLNAVFNSSQFWDGRSTSLQDQAIQPFTGPIEFGLHDIDQLLDRLRKNYRYKVGFESAYHEKQNNVISKERVGAALAAYETTLISGNSAFDRYKYGFEPNALTVSQQRGFVIFTGPGKCVTCHLIEMKHSLFTDSKFHSSSVGLERLGKRLPDVVERALARMARAPESIGAMVMTDPDIAELGRFNVTGDPKDIGKFKTPTLRNVVVTGPYMHNGSVATLQEAVDLETYQRTDEAGRPIILTPLERADLVDFLSSLTGADVLAARTAVKTGSSKSAPAVANNY